jgi:hypothetical protein
LTVTEQFRISQNEYLRDLYSSPGGVVGTIKFGRLRWGELVDGIGSRQGMDTEFWSGTFLEEGYLENHERESRIT